MRINHLFYSNLYLNKRISAVRFILILILVSFPILSSDCNNLLNNEEPAPEKFVGNWTLIEQTGALQDICPQENVVFRADGVAELTCPEGQPILRDYSVSGAELFYDQTSLQYEYEFDDNDQKLNLYGVNVSRNLFYEKVTAAKNNTGKRSEGVQNNSSEAVK
ncbi:MAG TPA: hypothetical protein PKC58_08570 [Ignavibacteria bacterium]|nr:hypothetical protein [Ignavibacteria bacterium]